MFFDTNSIRSNSVNGDCDFEKVPPDKLCPSAKRVRVRVGVRVRVRVRVMVRVGVDC